MDGRAGGAYYPSMWTFAGLLVIAWVLWYWLRKIARVLASTGAVQEAAANRAAVGRGERPVSDDVDVSIFP